MADKQENSKNEHEERGCKPRRACGYKKTSSCTQAECDYAVFCGMLARVGRMLYSIVPKKTRKNFMAITRLWALSFILSLISMYFLYFIINLDAVTQYIMHAFHSIPFSKDFKVFLMFISSLATLIGTWFFINRILSKLFLQKYHIKLQKEFLTKQWKKQNLTFNKSEKEFLKGRVLNEEGQIIGSLNGDLDEVIKSLKEKGVIGECFFDWKHSPIRYDDFLFTPKETLIIQNWIWDYIKISPNIIND